VVGLKGGEMGRTEKRGGGGSGTNLEETVYVATEFTDRE
jgi:hypothetical protein